MKNKLSKLIDVKSIITLLFGLVFAYLAVVGKVSEDSFMTVFVMIMTYYFAKGKTVKESEPEDASDTRASATATTSCPYLTEASDNEVSE